MNTNDIYIALEFMYSSNSDYVVLQCHHTKDIPYLRRALIHLFGEPRKMIDNSFYYGDKRVMMAPISKEMTGIDPANVFYVSYKDSSDWHSLCSDNGVKQRLVPYDKCPWVHEGDIYNLLLRDGIKPDEALHRMFVDGLIRKGI